MHPYVRHPVNDEQQSQYHDDVPDQRAGGNGAAYDFINSAPQETRGKQFKDASYNQKDKSDRIALFLPAEEPAKIF
ncbi:hypothetical protein D3C71_1316790 [compost metagenome]